MVENAAVVVRLGLQRMLAIACLVTWGMASQADDYAAGWGPVVGHPLPLLEAPDQSGTPRTLDNLAGDQGLLLVLSRSADW